MRNKIISLEFNSIDTFSLNCTLSEIVLVEHLVVDLGEGFSFEQSEQVPSALEGSEDITLFVLALLEELGLELFEEQEEVLVIDGKSVFSDDGLHCEGVLTDGVEIVHLVGD